MSTRLITTEDMASHKADDGLQPGEKGGNDNTESEDITIHPCKDPTDLWKLLSRTQTVNRIKSLTKGATKPKGYLRFVCISDTNIITKEPEMPEGDILLHAGDFTKVGTRAEIDDFNSFLKKHKEKYEATVVVAGNHDLAFQLSNEEVRKKWNSHAGRPERMAADKGTFNPKKFLTNCIYLEDSEVTIKGYRIYGSPWQPKFMVGAFALDRGESLLEKWKKIPTGIDILLTHGPPLGHGDLCISGKHVGCAELLSTVQKRVKPKFHVFGHIHEVDPTGAEKFVQLLHWHISSHKSLRKVGCKFEFIGVVNGLKTSAWDHVGWNNYFHQCLNVYYRF